jgi:hypothetical protein
LLDLVWHRSTRDIPREVWSDCFGPPSEGLFWFRALESSGVGDQFTFFFGLLRDEGAPVGIVPAFVFDLPLELVLPPAAARAVALVDHPPLRKLSRLRTFFIGSVAGEEGHIGLGGGRRLQDVAALVHASARAQASKAGASMLVWKDFPETDREAMDALAKSTSIFRMVSYPGSSIPLAPGGYLAYLEAQQSRRRHKMIRRLRCGAEKLPLISAIVRQPTDAQIEEIFRLYWQTYQRGKTKFERLTKEFFAATARSDEAVFLIQHSPQSARMSSFMLLFDLGERVINQFIGIDYAATEGGFAYFQLFAAAYDWACTTGARVMQSGQTGYMAKLESGHTLVPLWNYCEHANGLMNWILGQVGRRITWESLDDQLREWLAAHPDALPVA